MSTLSKRLKELRENRGWTKVETSKRLGMKASSTYSNWEYGNREPDIEQIKAIASLFDVSVDYLIGGNDASIPSWADEQDKLDLKKFLDNQQEMYYGDIKLTEEEKKQLNDIVVGVFWKRMKEAKDKQIDKE